MRTAGISAASSCMRLGLLGGLGERYAFTLRADAGTHQALNAKLPRSAASEARSQTEDSVRALHVANATTAGKIRHGHSRPKGMQSVKAIVAASATSHAFLILGIKTKKPPARRTKEDVSKAGYQQDQGAPHTPSARTRNSPNPLTKAVTIYNTPAPRFSADTGCPYRSHTPGAASFLRPK